MKYGSKDGCLKGATLIWLGSYLCDKSVCIVYHILPKKSILILGYVCCSIGMPGYPIDECHVVPATGGHGQGGLQGLWGRLDFALPGERVGWQVG